jgi:hypothetical protein
MSSGPPSRGVRTAAAGPSSQHDWVTVGLLISLAPLSITLGILVAVSDAVSRVVGHRGKLIPRLQGRYKELRKNGAALGTTDPSAAVVVEPRGPKMTVLISGSNALALAMARELSAAGHRVVLSDLEQLRLLNRGRYSRGVSEFVRMQKYEDKAWRIFTKKSEELNYPERMLSLVQAKRPNIWIPCDDSVTDEEMMQAAGIVKMHLPSCSVYYPGPEALNLSWNQEAFMQFIESLDSKIKAPSSTMVSTRGEVHRMIGSASTHRPLVLSGPLARSPSDSSFTKGHHRWRDSGFSEPSSLDGATDVDEQELEKSYHLPLESLDKTYDLLATIPISPVSPWKASDIVVGKPCTVHALIANNTMRAFTAYLGVAKVTVPESDGESFSFDDPAVTNPIFPLDQASPLLSTLQSFTSGLITKLPGYVSGTITLRFVLAEKPLPVGVELRPWVIQCEFGTPKALLAIPGATTSWALSIAKPFVRQSPRKSRWAYEVAHGRSTGVYSLPGEFFASVIVPIWLFVIRETHLPDVLRAWRVFMDKVMFWREELWDSNDPGPFLWYWIVERPVIAFVDLVWRILTTLQIVSRSS